MSLFKCAGHVHMTMMAGTRVLNLIKIKQELLLCCNVVLVLVLT